jgi:hypothetical protein
LRIYPDAPVLEWRMGAGRGGVNLSRAVELYEIDKQHIVVRRLRRASAAAEDYNFVKGPVPQGLLRQQGGFLRNSAER